MTTATIVVYNWTGNGGYNQTYNSSQEATFNDDDNHYNGQSDASETVSIDGGPAGATQGAPYSISVSFTDTSGASHVETFNFFNTGGQWYFAALPGSEFTEGATLGMYQSHCVGWDYDDVACFCRGTFIETDSGYIRVENLAAGMQIRTLDDGFQPLRLVVSTKIGPTKLKTTKMLRPILITAGALGANCPTDDLYVSRQHRMLVDSPIANRLFAKNQVLVSAIKLTQMPGIFIDTTIEAVEYYHLVFDKHQIVFANGAPSESFLICPKSLKMLPQFTRDEIRSIANNYAAQFHIEQVGNTRVFQHELVRQHPNNALQRQLVARHLQNNKPLIPHSAAISCFLPPTQMRL